MAFPMRIDKMWSKRRITMAIAKRVRSCLMFFVLPLFVLLSDAVIAQPTSQVMTFEDGVDGQAIRSNIPGLEFITTAGYDWIYGDKRTGGYNVHPYGSCAYWCNGDFFAWLGPYQGYGRIDLEEGTVSSLRAGYSSYSTTYLDAYDAEGNLLQSATGGGNLYTNCLDYLSVDAPGIAYVIVHDAGNYWLIDDLEVTPEEVRILSIDAMETDNEAAHHTDKYGEPFVIRRGQTESSQGQDARFDVVVEVSEGYDPAYYDLFFKATLKTGMAEQVFTIPCTPDTVWSARQTVVEEDDNRKTVSFEINIPFNAPIGKYEFKAVLARRNSAEVLDEENFEKPVVVLFNPWCAGDNVSASGFSEDEKHEYILQKNGIVFKRAGWAPSPLTLHWNFDQYNTNTVDYIMHAISGMSSAELADSVKVGRILARSLRDVVIFGHWPPPSFADKAQEMGYGGDWYNPSYWAESSADAFEKYLYTYSKSKPVLFAQCFTYGGLTTSLLRGVGIPCRPVTSFDAGAWNFHVWNEGWMNRPDRPGYAGWQVFDGTYRTGPAPVGAIHNNAGGDYDVDFMRTEVGSAIYTKMVGSDEHEDILCNYKVCADTDTTTATSSVSPANISVVISGPVGVGAGESLEWTVSIANGRPEEFVGSFTAEIHAVVYNGNDLGVLLEHTNDVTVSPSGSISFTIELPEEEYISSLSLTNLFELRLTLESGLDTWEGVGKGWVELPCLRITRTPSGAMEIGEIVNMTWELFNPLSVALSGGVINVRASEAFEVVTGAPQSTIPPVDPETTASGTIELRAQSPGEHLVGVTLSCNELGAVMGAEKITVASPAQFAAMVMGIDRLSVNCPIDLEVSVSNIGDHPGNGTVSALVPSTVILTGLQTRSLGEVPAGQSVSEVFTLTASQEGSYAIPFVVEGANGSIRRVTHYLSVYSYEHAISISADPTVLSGQLDSTVTLALVNHGNRDDSIDLHTYASTSKLNFELYEGSTRVIGQPVSVPPNGTKQLYLAIEGTGYAGEIVVTATSRFDPDATDRTMITVVGEAPPAPPGDLEAKVQCGAVVLTWQASPDESVTQYIVYRKGPGEYAFTEYATSDCCLLEDTAVGVGNTYSYRLRAVTAMGLESEDTDAVTITVVTNNAPIADAGADQFIVCSYNSLLRTKATLDGSNSSDPDGDSLTYTWTGPFDESPAHGPTPTVTLSDGCPGDYIIRLVVNDGEFDSYPDEVVVTVEDPTATLTYDGDTLVSTHGSPRANINLVATMLDDAGNLLDIDGAKVTFTLEGEGVGTIAVDANSQQGVAQRVLALQPAIYKITVTLDCSPLAPSGILVVYNPEGGFATGGGWIVPEDDRLNTHPDVRANFGFDAKYKQDDPMGHLEFRYSDGFIDLKSSSIERLVITGRKIVQFKGWASVNHEPGYWFFVKGIDEGEPGTNDYFDIKIWAPGFGEEGDPTDRAGGMLHGGNIVVHTR